MNIGRSARRVAELASVQTGHLVEYRDIAVQRRRHNDCDAPIERTARDEHYWREKFATADVVSFDVFGTLVIRSVAQARDVHTVVRAMADAAGLTPPRDWRDARVQGEAAARRRSELPDITLADIYAQLTPSIVSATLGAALQAIECDCEQALARPTPVGQRAYAVARALNKTIVMTSDMYLPRAVITAILRSCGYELWDRLYLSGDDGTAKLDGSTFTKLRADHGPDARIVHVGDDHRRDVAATNGSGIEPVHVPRALSAAARRRSGIPRIYRSAPVLSGSAVFPDAGPSLISGLYEGWVEAASRNLLPHREIGYTVLGPALTGFARYLQATDLSGRNRYTFLAREGLIFQRAYEAMHPESRDRSHYLRISTRAIGSALLTARLDDSDLRFLTKTPISLRASEYVTRIVPELGPDETDAILRKFDVGATDRMSSLEARARLQPVFAYLSDELAQVGERSRAALAHYLHPLALEHDDVRIVDIGWSGTIQAGLERLLEVALQGSYFALVDVARTRSNDRMHAWADARRGGSLAMLVQTMYRNVQPLEVLAAEASVGSLASVSEGADGEPVLGFLPREFPPVDVAVIDDIQDAALEFVRDFSEYVTGRSLPIDLLDPRTALEPLRMLLTKPSAAQAGVLSNVHFDGSYGTRARKVGSWWYPPRVRRWR